MTDLTAAELSEAITLLSQQFYRRAVRHVGEAGQLVTASVVARAGGPLVRMELSLAVIQHAPVPDGGEPILVPWAANEGRAA